MLITYSIALTLLFVLGWGGAQNKNCQAFHQDNSLFLLRTFRDTFHFMENKTFLVHILVKHQRIHLYAAGSVASVLIPQCTASKISPISHWLSWTNSPPQEEEPAAMFLLNWESQSCPKWRHWVTAINGQLPRQICIYINFIAMTAGLWCLPGSPPKALQYRMCPSCPERIEPMKTWYSLFQNRWVVTATAPQKSPDELSNYMEEQCLSSQWTNISGFHPHWLSSQTV